MVGGGVIGRMSWGVMMSVEQKLAVFFSMQKARDELGQAGSCVTGRIAAGDVGCDGSPMGSRVPQGIFFDGDGGLALYQQVGLAFDKIRLQSRDHYHALYYHGLYGRSFRQMADDLEVSETVCRGHHRSAMFAMSVLLS